MKTAFSQKLAGFLEKIGLRCGKCHSWRKTRIITHNTLEYGLNLGGVFFMDAYRVRNIACCCTHCGHVMSERNIKLPEK